MYIQQLVYVLRLCSLVVCRIDPASSMAYTNCCIYSYREVPPDGEQLACSKYVDVNY